MEVGAVVAAAGMSSRMGGFKPMLSIGTISIAQRVTATLRQGGAGKIVVVTGCNAEELERHLAKERLIFLHNNDYAHTEMFDSVKIGLEYLRDKCDKVFFTPVDVPLFTAATVHTLLECGADLACPVCNGERGHPILMSAEVIDRVLTDSGEGGMKGALERCGIPMKLVEVDDPGILLDADTPEDYDGLLKLHNSQLFRPILELSVARERKFLDSRVAMLLSLTDETSSVRLACQRMQLSYSSGWNLINRLERELGYVVVERMQGGRRGGRSHLTDKGRELLSSYESYVRRLNNEAVKLFSEYFPELQDS